MKNQVVTEEIITMIQDITIQIEALESKIETTIQNEVNLLVQNQRQNIVLVQNKCDQMDMILRTEGEKNGNPTESSTAFSIQPKYSF